MAGPLPEARGESGTAAGGLFFRGGLPWCVSDFKLHSLAIERGPLTFRASMPAWMTGAKTVSFSLESANISGIWSSKLRAAREQRQVGVCFPRHQGGSQGRSSGNRSPCGLAPKCRFVWNIYRIIPFVDVFSILHFRWFRLQYLSNSSIIAVVTGHTHPEDAPASCDLPPEQGCGLSER